MALIVAYVIHPCLYCFWISSPSFQATHACLLKSTTVTGETMVALYFVCSVTQNKHLKTKEMCFMLTVSFVTLISILCTVMSLDVIW